MPTRRHFLRSAAALATAAPLSGFAEKTSSLPPVRQLTGGPKFHWFGYYDKLEFDPGNRYVLSNQVDFEGRTPTADDRIQVGIVDTGDGDKWTELGKSDAWGWQQGCMLQWRPGSKSEVVWNDREEGQFICHILDFQSGKKRTLPRAIYALGADGKYGISADFARIQRLRPGYGYQGVPDPTAKVERPEDSGIWRVDMQSGDSELILSIAEISRFQADSLPNDSPDAHHYFNHLLVSPDSKRFIFLHRWRGSKTRSFMTRMLTANIADGSDLRVVDPSGYTSHFIWRDPETITAWSRHESHSNAFYRFKDVPAAAELTPEPIGLEKMPLNGHNTYLPQHENEWILNDTYPDKDKREQHVYLYHVPTDTRVPIGNFHSPALYVGEWRCDTHPRYSNDGTKVVIDSPHNRGRQLHLIDVSEIVSNPPA